MREKEGESSKYSLVSLDLDYLLFGHGRHAWYVYQPFWLESRWLTVRITMQPGPFLCGQRGEDYACSYRAEL